ncbi:MAG: hypothetical protein DLM64_01435 [Solirubrobacterales bacterium]|nr:MAG: hypothetical protein DLM64_01435 [Solirubrobacterales bacterium]
MAVQISIKARITLAALALALASAPALAIEPALARAGVLYLSSCSGFGDSGADTDIGGLVWGQSSSGSYSNSNRCGQGGSFEIDDNNSSIRGAGAEWGTSAPAGIEIVHAYTPAGHVLVNSQAAAQGYRVDFFWAGGTQTITPASSPINAGIGPSPYFGFQAYCASSSCKPLKGQLLDISAVQLQGMDTTPPAIAAVGADNLWYQSGHYVRGGGWPTSFQASAAAGVCAMVEQVDGRTIVGPSDPYPNGHSWTQCPTPVTMSQAIDTTQYPNGPLSLTLAAHDAASPANTAGATHDMYVDNTPVTLALSGPTDAPSTAGTQYVSAVAAAGPSGVHGIACSVDGGPYRGYPGASAQVPVQGLGQHQVLCVASNNAFNVYSKAAVSPTESWSLGIREPTVIGASFMQVGGLHCSRHTERIYVPGHPVKRRLHGKLVYLRRAGHFHTVKVLRCSAPKVSTHTTERVALGHRTTVSGELLARDGTALGDQGVRIMTAPDNGAGQFSQAASATTGTDGSWSATLPPGPSRLVEAQYGGGAAAEPSTSAPIHIVVPASAQIEIHPHRTHWGGTITISGRLAGGYVPPAGELVVLRIGWSSGSTEIGHLYAGSDGRFRTKYTFLRGRGSETYRLWAQTAAESDYPYAPASSTKVTVRVGP